MAHRPTIRSANIRDVARRAGVSHQTVSRVLNANPTVSDATRDRVLVAMAELEYRPSPIATALSTSKSRVLGILTASTTQYGPISSIASIEQAARDANHWVCTVDIDPSQDESIADGLEHLQRLGIDGLVVIAPQARVLELLSRRASNRRIVILGAATSEVAIGLSVDQVEGARLATGHLIDEGHTRVAVLTGPEDWSEARARTDGASLALRQAGLTPVAIAGGDWTSASGYLAGQRLLDSEATAVFAANDQMALGLMHAARQHGLDVPRDLSVVGFDDIPEAANFWPPLTTVRQDFPELGRRAVALLLGLSAPAEAALAPQLIIRESVAPPVRAGSGK